MSSLDFEDHLTLWGCLLPSVIILISIVTMFVAGAIALVRLAI